MVETVLKCFVWLSFAEYEFIFWIIAFYGIKLCKLFLSVAARQLTENFHILFEICDGV